MALSCSYVARNKQGEELQEFRTYRKELGYKTAAKTFLKVLSPTFQEKFRKYLEFDSQGVPTYQSAMRVPYIQNFIGTAKLMEGEQKSFPYVENTRENFKRLVQSAQSYNTSSELRDKLVAVVTPSKDNSEIRVEIREKTDSSVEEFRNQYGVIKLNEALENMFGDLGVTIDILESNEIANGRVDFTKAANIADGFKGLISIANGMEGELALPEEAAHTLIGILRDDPLIQRSLAMLASNEKLLREVMGDEYDTNRDYYLSHPNYDALGNEVPVEGTLAEEALGKVLQEKLKTTSSSTSLSADSNTGESNALRTLVQRIINKIKSLFKGRDADAITRAKNEVDTSMGELAKQILQGTRKIDKEDVVKARRNARFYQVREKTDKVLELLQNANEVERKRSKMIPKEKKKEIKQRIITLEAIINDKDKLEGVHTYAKWALADLQDAMEQLDISGTLESYDFKHLRHIKTTLDSYGEFIREFHEVLDEIGDDAVIVIDGEEVNLRELWKEIDDLYKSCTDSYAKQALAAFSDFIAPIYNISPLKDEYGNVIPVEEVLLGKDFDISEFDRWLTSAGNSTSILIGMFDKAVKNAKDEARKQTILDNRKIWRIRDNAERRGIKSFGWMFERNKAGKKTGNYISRYNEGQFYEDEQEMLKSLTEKYGKHPIGENSRKMQMERRAWYSTHALRDSFGNYRPNETYKNPEYDNLTSAQRQTLDEILEYKAEVEKKFPQDKRDLHRAIQRRRSGTQRLLDVLSKPENAMEAIKEDIKSTFRKTDDDDQLWGESTHGLTDFKGRDYLTLPILYTHRLTDPEELSDDVIGDLMLYTCMANNYEQMAKIYDPLEIGAEVVAGKKFVKNVGTKAKEEVINAYGKVTKRDIKLDENTNFARKLKDFLECQVYGRYLKEDDVIGPNAQKSITFFQRMTSTAYLGCNLLAGVANVATAIGMQNIEAAAGEFFRHRDLAKADFEYGKLLVAFLAELTSLKKQSELALFDELFDVRQNAKDKPHNVQLSNIFRRFFGQNWLFIQQGMGDHWIYNRTAIAMAMRRNVNVNGKIMSVWDARQIVTDENGYKRMIINPAAKNLDGSDFNAFAFGREIAKINHDIAGIYNDEDQNAANRVVLGRAMQQMRKWIVPQMMRRFQSKRTILDIGKEEEGYYRAFGRLALDVWKSGFKIATEWDKLSVDDKRNCKRAFWEIGQTFGLWRLLWFLGSGVKDPDRHWALKFAEYMLNREVHELGFLTPGPLMLTEGYKTVTSPMVMLSAGNSIAQAMLTTVWPGNWFPDEDELIQSGPYKGHSHLYKRWAQLPVPPMTQVRQLEKFFDDLDTGTKYYSKDYK
jgi:hypothetical protein